MAPGRDATFDLAAVHEPNIPVECYLVVFMQKGRTTTTWVNKSSWTYRWQITAWDDLAKEWAHVSSTAYLTVTR